MGYYLVYKLLVREETSFVLCSHDERNPFLAGELFDAGLLGIEVVEARFATNELTGFGKLQALGIGFVRFFGRHDGVIFLPYPVR